MWQCREAVMRALAMWEKIAGPLKHWQGSAKRKKLKVNIDEGSDLNAYYDRQSLGYYHFRSKKTKLLRRFAASTDVVSHECGHALLDAVRPELWDSNFPEPNAFHEAFGDCVALLTALADLETRKALLKQAPKLASANFVETLIESLANGLRDFDATHNGAKARHARNTYRWVIPSTLPDDGGPGVLINEIHSFGQVFVGCFYDVIRNIFGQSPKKDAKALSDAAIKAGKLLVRAAVKAHHAPRFYQAVGRAMSLEDEHLHAGKHRDAIRDLRLRGMILLGSDRVLAPRRHCEGKAGGQGSKAAAPRGEGDAGRSQRHAGGFADAPHAHVRPRRRAPRGQATSEVSLKVSVRQPRSALGSELALIGHANRHAAVFGARRTSRQPRTRYGRSSEAWCGAARSRTTPSRRRNPADAARSPARTAWRRTRSCASMGSWCCGDCVLPAAAGAGTKAFRRRRTVCA